MTGGKREKDKDSRRVEAGKKEKERRAKEAMGRVCFIFNVTWRTVTSSNALLAPSPK